MRTSFFCIIHLSNIFFVFVYGMVKLCANHRLLVATGEKIHTNFECYLLILATPRDMARKHDQRHVYEQAFDIIIPVAEDAEDASFELVRKLVGFLVEGGVAEAEANLSSQRGVETRL